MNKGKSLQEIEHMVLSIKERKWIEKIINKVEKIIFKNGINELNIQSFDCFHRTFYALYHLMKKKFKDRYRKISGERYFEHLRWVVYNVLELPNPNTDKVLIAIAHDSIEDTNKSYETLNEDYEYKVALSVLALSKEPWENYIEEEKTEEKARKKVRSVYFSHLESFESMKEHIKSLAISKWLEIWEEELIEITQNTLDVKFADRIHNLSTQWHPDDQETVRRKVNETKKYFLKIAQETNFEAYIKLKKLILELEIRLLDAKWKVNWII